EIDYDGVTFFDDVKTYPSLVGPLTVTPKIQERNYDSRRKNELDDRIRKETATTATTVTSKVVVILSFWRRSNKKSG
ncbi:14093_t:CDS:2, partial [Cetraspora pellucida]